MYCHSPDSIMRSKWSEKRPDSIEAYEEKLIFFHKNKYRLAYRELERIYTFC